MSSTVARDTITRARRLVGAGKPLKAKQLVERTYAEHPQDEALARWLPLFLMESGGYDRAIPALETAVRAEPSFLPAAHALVQIPLRQRRYLQAVDRYDEITDIADLASTMRSTSQTDPVGVAYRDALERHPAPEHDCLVFYHLPFTGGTSWQRSLNFLFDARERFNVSRRDGLMALARYDTLPSDKRSRVRYIHLHHPYPLVTESRRLLFFTTLRDPVARFLSGYHKRRHQPKILGTGDWTTGTPDLRRNVEYAASVGLANSQAKQLAILHPSFHEVFAAGCPPVPTDARVGAEEDLFYVAATRDVSDSDLLALATEVLDTNFLVPGVLEHMEASYLSVFAQLGIPVIPRLPHIGASGRTNDPVDEDLSQLILELHGVDAELYAGVRRRFEERFGSLIEAIDNSLGL